MPKWKSTRIEYKIREALLELFKQGAKLTIGEIIVGQLNPNSPYKYLIAKNKIVSILHSVKRILAEEEIPFGCVNHQEQWGIPTTKEEFQYMGIRRYKLVKGVIEKTSFLMSSGVKQGLLDVRSKRETMMLPIVNGKKKTSTGRKNG